MSIHAGEAIYADGGYIGFDVHRGARLCQAGHGEQVLVSEAARELLEGVELRDLGTHWLRGLPEPERIFQLLAPGLPTEFPPLRHVATRRPNAEASVVLGDDSVLLREGIARLLEESGFAVAAQADDLDGLLTAVAETAPDVVIADLRMPPSYSDEGLQAARTIRERHPGTGVLVLSQYAEPAYARELLADGTVGVGYLLKDRVADVTEFAAAVRQVSGGGAAVDREVVSLLGDGERDWSALAFPRA
jgi:DNA-binding NarL/FixJ family response regulator